MIQSCGAREARSRRTDGVAPAVEVDPDARARLAALGYVGTFVAERRRIRAGRADPKDKISAVQPDDARSAKDRAPGDKESDERGFTLLDGSSREDPKVIDAWFMLGNEYLPPAVRAAIEQFKRALALKPDYDLVVINMANAYRALGTTTPRWSASSAISRLDPKNARSCISDWRDLARPRGPRRRRRSNSGGAGDRPPGGGCAERARRDRAQRGDSPGAERRCASDRDKAGRPARALQSGAAGRAAGGRPSGRAGGTIEE